MTAQTSLDSSWKAEWTITGVAGAAGTTVAATGVAAKAASWWSGYALFAATASKVSTTASSCGLIQAAEIYALANGSLSAAETALSTTVVVGGQAVAGATLINCAAGAIVALATAYTVAKVYNTCVKEEDQVSLTSLASRVWKVFF